MDLSNIEGKAFNCSNSILSFDTLRVRTFFKCSTNIINFFSLFRSHRPFRVSEKDLLITGPNCIFLTFHWWHDQQHVFSREIDVFSFVFKYTVQKIYCYELEKTSISLENLRKTFSQFILFYDIARCSEGNTFSRGLTKMGEWSEDNSIEDLTSIKSIVTEKSRISRAICRYFIIITFNPILEIMLHKIQSFGFMCRDLAAGIIIDTHISNSQ